MKSKTFFQTIKKLYLIPFWAYFFYLGCASHIPDQIPEGGMSLHFVRHAETIANKTGEKTPENYSTFTRRGEKEIIGLTKKLKKMSIDQVLVSPTIRTRLTVLPYLKATNKHGEIWPELEEWRMEGQIRLNMNSDSDTITIEPQNKDFFQFRNPLSNRWAFARTFEGGMQQLDSLVWLIEKRYGQSGRSILIVGHMHLGSRMIEKLLGLSPRVRFILETAKITTVRQNHDGQFELIRLNGKKVK